MEWMDPPQEDGLPQQMEPQQQIQQPPEMEQQQQIDNMQIIEHGQGIDLQQKNNRHQQNNKIQDMEHTERDGAAAAV